MVRKKIKAKKAMLSFHEVESRQVEDFVQCLEDKETNIGPEFMELYEEQAKTNASKTLNLLNNIKDKEDMQHDPLDEMKECSQELLQSSAEADEEMAQCVPELPKTPQRHIQPKKVSRLKENQRPKFKTTPTRKDIENEKLGKQKKMKLCKENNETETKTKKPKISEIADQGGSCFKTKNKEGSWIQCSRVDCLKWRKIPNDIEPTTVADRWVCAMNPDESHMECAASQETCDSQVDYDVVYTPFSAGSLVWAKVPGYPWWPGIVEDDPDYNCCYEIDESEVNPISFHVSFVFDKDVSRSWVSYMSIRSFIGTDNPNETNSKFKKHSKSLLKAITQARSAVDLPINERLKNFSFRALYKGPIGKAKTKKEKDQIHSPSDSQGSQASILFDDKKKSNKVKKTKKPKVSKCSPANSHKSHNGGENAGVQENKEKILKKKKKRKKIILSSADEDDEHEKEGNCETGLGRNMKAAGETDNEAFDHEPKKQKAIKKSVKKKDSPKKTDSVEENPTTGETRHDISQMEIEGTLECKPTNEKEREPGKTVNKDSGKNKLKRKQAKKCKETSQESKQNESICSNAEEEGSVTCSKKQKKKVTDKENKKDAPDMENNGKAKKGKQDNAKGFQTKKTKQTKEEETSGVKSAKIKKKKKILKDGFNSTSILNSSNESSNRSITEDPTVVDSVAKERSSKVLQSPRQKIESVALEGLVVLKVIQHCQEDGSEGDVVQGVLLGLVEGSKLEITNCFPFSQNSDENDDEDIYYQMEMMRHLRSVNIDHLHVGWYQSTYLGSFVNKNLLESQFSYQNSIAESIVLVYDPLKTSQGMLSFKALRLSQKMMDLYAEREFTPSSLSKTGMKHDEMFEEIPLVIRNSNLVNTLLCKLDESLTEPEQNDFLSLARGTFIEKNVQLLMETVDELCQDTQKFHNYQRNSSRQQQQKDSYVQKKKAENQARKDRGEVALPDEDISKIFKPPAIPSRLENLLLSGQAENYCKEINEFASQSFAKLFLSEALQGTQ